MRLDGQRRRAFGRVVVGMLAAAMVTLGWTDVAAAKECGCTLTGDYEAPDSVLPQAGATSPGGAYRLETSQNGNFVTLTIRNASSNAIVTSFTPPIARLQYGWSPDGARFLYRYAAAGNSVQLDDINVYDVAARASRLGTTVSAGAAAAFSPEGGYFFVNSITNGNNANLSVYDAETGARKWSAPYIFTTPPGTGGQTFSAAG